MSVLSHSLRAVKSRSGADTLATKRGKLPTVVCLKYSFVPMGGNCVVVALALVLRSVCVSFPATMLYWYNSLFPEHRSTGKISSEYGLSDLNASSLPLL